MGFKEPSFADRAAAARNARKNIVEKFKAQPGADDPAVLQRAAERQAQAAARAEAQKLREAEKAEQRAREAELAAQAAAEALRIQAEKQAAEAELKAQQKAARDAGRADVQLGEPKRELLLAVVLRARRPLGRREVRLLDEVVRDPDQRARVGQRVEVRAPRVERARRHPEVARPLDVHVSLAAASLGGALVAWTGGTAGPLSALPVLVVAIGVALGHARRTWLLVVFGVGLEVALHRASHGAADPLAMGLRAALIVAAAGLHHGLTRVEVARVRAHATQLLADERKRQKEDARSLRLAAPAPAAAPPPAQRNERVDEARVRSSLEEIHASLVGLLELARRTMRLHTCALYWTDAKGRSLRIVEAATAGDLQVEPLASTSGLLGATLNHGKTLALAGLRDEHPGLTHYATPAPVRCFAGVPVLDDGVARGVLAADRTDDAPFTPDDQATLEAVALQARRLIDNERVFARLERARDDLSRLFNASRALGEALTEDEVLQAVALSARSIVDHDLLVVTGYDAKSGEHKVRHVAGAAPRGLDGLTFGDNAGIASAAVKARHALPYKGQFDAKAQYVFTKDVAMGDVSSVLVLPLVVRDAVLGAVTLAAQRRAAFPEGTRQLLGVLAGHASVALANAAAVRRLEELATTDPMTGHLNKRAFEQEFDRRLRAAERFARSLAVVVLDIDKFKGVNDTR
jgi:GAF domain-containing protein